MKQSWIDFCLFCIRHEATFLSHGNRKIIRGINYTFNSFEPDLTLPDIGYSKQKLSLLKSLYYHEEAVAAASKMWSYLLQRGKYSSACFHTYNHYVKEGNRSPGEKESTRSPCLQSVVLTLVKDGKQNATCVDVFYRTTELFKKFPADLIFLHWVLYEHFSFEGAPIKSVTFHFANMTIHPMYVSVPLPHFDKPMRLLKEIAAQKNAFAIQTFKWLRRYLENNASVNKFRQARSVKNSFIGSFKESKLNQIHEFTKEVLDDLQ